MSPCTATASPRCSFGRSPARTPRSAIEHLRAAKRVRIEKRGDFFYAFVAGKDGNLHPAGASIKLALTGDFYVGIGVCSHEKDATEKAVFSNVKLEVLALRQQTGETAPRSSLETISIASTDRRVAYVAPAHFEAPNWSRDGSFLIFNQEGTHPPPRPRRQRPHRHSHRSRRSTATTITASRPTASSSPSATQPPAITNRRVYIVPIAGGTPRLITPNAPSYWHGWSPDGKTLAFTGQRDDNFDIYSIPFAGGDETRLTTAPGLDDGPEYSPDGAYIYFNSERTGHMQIWRMKPDGCAQEQVLTSDDKRLVPAHLARRQVDGLSHLRKRRHRPSAQQRRDAAPDVACGQKDQGAGTALRRTGHHQCSILVAGQCQARLRQL